MTEELVSHTDGQVHRLTINRPARRNALTPDARARAGPVSRRTRRGPVRPGWSLLTGAGGHFCAGLDLAWLRSLGGAESVHDLQRGLGDFQSAVLAIVRCPVPVIAVMQGAAAGFGLDLAVACDMRIAGASATFTSAFARMGLVPDGGSTFTLPRLLGAGTRAPDAHGGGNARRPACPAIGLVDEVVDEASLDLEVKSVIDQLFSGAPRASAPSSDWCVPGSSARWNRRWPPRARHSCRPCRDPNFAGGWRRFLAR